MHTLRLLRWQTFGPLVALLACLSMASAGQTPASKYASSEASYSHPGRVDVALVLAVDVSASIDAMERQFQRKAYAQALSDPRVAQMALGGRSGRVAISYMEWSGRRYQRVHLPMRIMSTPDELAQFATDILSIQDDLDDRMFFQPTAVGNALIAAEHVISQLQVPAGDYVIDISGDGVRNEGFAVDAVRDGLLSLGLTVNGLPIEVSTQPPDQDIDQFQRVTHFYEDCVIGGPGAFHLVARGFNDIRETLIMKLMLEMAQLPAENKRRIAAAWNAGGMDDTLRVIPATVLQLSPPNDTPRRPASDCGDTSSPGSNPFAVRQ